MVFSLTQSQIEHFKTNGHVILPSVFGETDLREIDQAIRDLTKQAIESGKPEKVLELEPEPVNGKCVPRRIYNPFHQHDAFRKLATDDRILDRIESLIGPNISLHHSKLNMKPAKVGSVVEWHQDLAYFPHTNDDLVTTLVYLDEATEENGCLQVLPKHHTHYFEHRLADGSFAGMITETIDDGRHGNPVPLPAAAGSVIFMHCITPHSSLPNRSNEGRRTLIFEYRAADAFPIYFGEYVKILEDLTCHVRGERARFARFGGPRPMIPHLADDYKSIYALQEEGRTKYGSIAEKAGKTGS